MRSAMAEYLLQNSNLPYRNILLTQRGFACCLTLLAYSQRVRRSMGADLSWRRCDDFLPVPQRRERAARPENGVGFGMEGELPRCARPCRRKTSPPRRARAWAWRLSERVEQASRIPVLVPLRTVWRWTRWRPAECFVILG